jgi:hypothetical protein
LLLLGNDNGPLSRLTGSHSDLPVYDPSPENNGVEETPILKKHLETGSNKVTPELLRRIQSLDDAESQVSCTLSEITKCIVK